VHAAVVRIRASAYRAALYRDAMESAGVPTSMPFFDHQVLAACMATRPEHRTPWQPKPLLRTALRPLVAAEVLSRKTKGFYNHDIYRGWKDNRDQVQDLLADSRLAQLGLVDAGVLRRELAAFGPSGLPPGFVTDLVALEVWLRYFTPRAACRGPATRLIRRRSAPTRLVLARGVAASAVEDGKDPARRARYAAAPQHHRRDHARRPCSPMARPPRPPPRAGGSGSPKTPRAPT
jgi:hypothetical protein